MKYAAVAVVALTAIASSHGAPGPRAAPTRLGGTPLELVPDHDSVWVLTCDRGCTGEGKMSVGRIIHVDGRTGRILASRAVSRPGAVAVGPGGVYLTDFWRGTVRLLDRRTLHLATTVKLKLQRPIVTSTTRDDAFLPLEISTAGGAVWVATDRGALARIDPRLDHVTAMVSLPLDAFEGMVTGSAGVWLSESLLGVYRVSTTTNRVVARIKTGAGNARLVPNQLFLAGHQLLAVGAWTEGVVTDRNGLARIDPAHDRLEGITALPPGQLTAAGSRVALGRTGRRRSA